MAKKKRAADNRIITIAVVLTALTVAATGLFHWLGEPAGRAFLLDVGLNGKFDRVQRALEGAVYEGLVAAGVERGSIAFEKGEGPGEKLPVMHIRADVPHDFPLVRANDEIDRRLDAVGGRVRSCREREDGRSIRMELGTRRAVTHVCVVRRSRSAAHDRGRRENLPSIAVIVDDFGFFFNSLVRSFLEIDVPLTLSIMPGLKHSSRICEAAALAGKEMICHLPMEPKKGADDYGDIPLVRTDMSAGEIERIVERALGSVPGVVGMNNHMGSLATEDKKVMDAVLRVCRDRDIFFVDSRTTNRSVVGEVALSIGVNSLSNDIFMDNKGEDTRENMRKLLSIAKRRGGAVGIMHVRKDSLTELRWLVEESRRVGVQFVPVSEMIDRIALAMEKGG